MYVVIRAIFPDSAQFIVFDRTICTSGMNASVVSFRLQLTAGSAPGTKRAPDRQDTKRVSSRARMRNWPDRKRKISRSANSTRVVKILTLLLVIPRDRLLGSSPATAERMASHPPRMRSTAITGKTGITRNQRDNWQSLMKPTLLL